MSNAILNLDRTRKNIVSVDEATARDPECSIDILEADIFVTSVPTIPDDMFLPKLSEDGSEWIEADAVGRDANFTTEKESTARAKRDNLLSQCDWTQIPDVQLDAAIQAAWATYRQALRDVSAQVEFPNTIIWPIAPADTGL